MYNTFPFEKVKILSFASSIMKTYIFMFPAQSRITVRLICYIAFGSESSACCLLYLWLSSNTHPNKEKIVNNRLCNFLCPVIIFRMLLYVLILFLTG